MSLLTDLSLVRAGASVRGRLETDEGGNERVVLAKDIGAGGGIDAKRLTRVMDSFGESAPRLLPGDVIIQCRGVTYPVAVADENVAGAVVVSPLCLIRPDPRRLDGAFLALFLAHPRTQVRLRAKAVGTYVPELSREAVATFDIPMPSLAQQREIAEIGNLMRRERALLERLAATQNSLLLGLIERAANSPRGASTPPGERRSAGASTAAGLDPTPSTTEKPDGYLSHDDQCRQASGGFQGQDPPGTRRHLVL